MQRVVRLSMAYDGTAFRGWARQRDPAVRTIEGVLTRRLEEILGENVRLSVAGRTDAGVHARGQVASFTTSSGVLPERIQKALNAGFSPEIVVKQASFAPRSFDARRSATGREYTYVIDTGEVSDPFTGRFEWHRPVRLEVVPMRVATRSMVGEHDFTSFCRHPGPGRSTVRRLIRASVQRQGALVLFGFRADSFLHQMVRAMVGTLVLVGEGRIDPGTIASILAARERSGTGNLAPARGLILERIFYGSRADRRPRL